MKSSKLILALWLSTGAFAHTLPQKQPVDPTVGAKPNAAATAAPGSTNGQRANQHATASRANSVERSSRGRRGSKAVKPSSAKPALAAVGGRATVADKSRRDPFVSPVVERIRNTANCSGGGKQCLLVGDISFHGVVTSPGGFIAVVMNGEHTYFLRENDPLADGSVERITKDTIVLRERSSDALGRSLTREVTKKLGAPPV